MTEDTTRELSQERVDEALNDHAYCDGCYPNADRIPAVYFCGVVRPLNVISSKASWNPSCPLCRDTIKDHFVILGGFSFCKIENPHLA